MANWGPVQILLVALVIIVLFGSKKLPELARSLGKAKGEFKKGCEEGEKLIKEEEEKKQLAEKQEEGAEAK